MDKRELLQKFYLFKGINPNDVYALNAIVEAKVYMSGDLVFSEGEGADALFIVEMGTVDIMPKGKETVFATIGSGQGFGELGFFDRGKRPASVSSRERTHLLRIAYEPLSKLLSERSEFALLVYRNGCTFFAKHFRTIAFDLNRRYL